MHSASLHRERCTSRVRGYDKQAALQKGRDWNDTIFDVNKNIKLAQEPPYFSCIYILPLLVFFLLLGHS